MAMMAITTRSSMRVNPGGRGPRPPYSARIPMPETYGRNSNPIKARSPMENLLIESP
jgi:hypothetical protein